MKITTVIGSRQRAVLGSPHHLPIVSQVEIGAICALEITATASRGDNIATKEISDLRFVDLHRFGEGTSGRYQVDC
jgi:hypothetical protein